MVDTIEVVLLTVLAILSALGGVPHLLQWIKNKPCLKIIQASIDKPSRDDFRYLVHLEVENRRRWWRKSGDASNVVAEYYLIDKGALQRGYVSGQLVSPFLLSGARAAKDVEGYHVLQPEGNPYTVVFRVFCNESAWDKMIIAYEVPP
jgi:hypothetical protein